MGVMWERTVQCVWDATTVFLGRRGWVSLYTYLFLWGRGVYWCVCICTVALECNVV